MKHMALVVVIAVVCSTAAAEDVVMGPELIISQLDNQQLHPRVAYNSVEDEFLVVWHNHWPGNRDIYAQRLDGEGNPLSWFAVAFGGNDRIDPDVAYDPVHNRYLVVYLHDYYGDGSDWDVRGRFIDWDGPDPAWPEFLIDTSSENQSDPQVVFGRAQEEFLTVWTSAGPGVVDHVEGSRIASADPAAPSVGAQLDIAVSTHARRHPDVAYNLARNEYLVVYDIDNGGATGYDIAASRLRGDGVPLGAEIFVYDGSVEDHNPVVAACARGDQYLVVWSEALRADIIRIWGDGAVQSSHLCVVPGQDSALAISCPGDAPRFDFTSQFSHGPMTDTVEAIMIKTAPMVWDWRWDQGIVVDTGGAAETTHPAIASGRKTTLVVWEHDRPGTSFQDLHGRILWPPIFTDGFNDGTTDAWSATLDQAPGP